MLKTYLQLFRIPGVFTAVSNVVMGFLVSYTSTQNPTVVIPLIISSSLLYFSGMILNDYFDYSVDKRQRPWRPLPSEKISRKSALFLGITFIFCANIIALFVGTPTFLLILLMSILILSYDIVLKNIVIIGIPILCTIRALNVMLGASTAEFNPNLVLLVIPIVFLIASVSILSRTETEIIRLKTLITSLIMTALSIVSVPIILLQNYNHSFIVFLFLFVVVTIYASVKFSQKNNKSIQNKITYQLLSIILLDAVLIAAFSDLVYASVVAILFIPAYLLTKRIYVT